MLYQNLNYLTIQTATMRTANNRCKSSGHNPQYRYKKN